MINVESLQSLISLSLDDDQTRQWLNTQVEMIDFYFRTVEEERAFLQQQGKISDEAFYFRCRSSYASRRDGHKNGALLCLRVLNKLAVSNGLEPVYGDVRSLVDAGLRQETEELFHELRNGICHG